MISAVSIGDRVVGPGHEPFVVAELSGNHNGSLDRAMAIMRAAAAAGADAVKLQTYTADSMTLDCDRPEFKVSADHPLWGGRSLHSLYLEAAMPYDWHEPLFELARALGIQIFSTPFDLDAVALLEALGAPAYKVASLEVIDIPLIRRIAQTGKPLILSTGTATWAEIGHAVEEAKAAGCAQMIVLACTSSYPAPAAEANLARLKVMADGLGCIVGLSDHTKGISVSVAAVALGASMIEKHVTLRRADGGVDAAFSLEPDELAELKRGTRDAWQAVGVGRIGPSRAETESLRLRRSLWVVADVAPGDLVNTQNVRALRPSGGLPPLALDDLIGRHFVSGVPRGTPMAWDLIAPRP